MLAYLPLIFAVSFLLLCLYLISFYRRWHVKALLNAELPLYPYRNICQSLGIPTVKFLKTKSATVVLGGITTLGLSLADAVAVPTGYPLFIGIVLPDVILYGRYGFLLVGRKKEIEFLKRLFLLNGSVQPVVFDEVFQILKENARSLRPMFDALEQDRSANTSDLKELYQSVGDRYRDLEIRLFLEKLYQAECLDFQQGVESLRMDQMLQKMNRKREAEQLRTVIELFGVTFSVLLAGFLIYYLLLPWLSLHSMQMGW